MSDTHGTFMKLPEADIYVHTGDLYPNFGEYITNSSLRLWKITPELEAEKQRKWAAQNNWREHLGSPDSPIICVRGNHDFAETAPAFAGCDVTELVGNELHEISGLRFTGHRGIPYICGTWNDETRRPDLLDRAMRMPTADVYVTHYPPGGILDGDGWGRESWGLEGLANHMIIRTYHEDEKKIVAHHLFGHIHEQGGRMVQAGNVLFSNAATRFNVIDIEGK